MFSSFQLQPRRVLIASGRSLPTAIDKTIGFRVTAEEEEAGLDISQFGETARILDMSPNINPKTGAAILSPRRHVKAVEAEKGLPNFDLAGSSKAADPEAPPTAP